MDNSGKLPILSDDDPLFEVAAYTQQMNTALNSSPTTAATLNGWQNFGGGYQNMTFHRMGRMVFVTGMIKPGTLTSGTAVANIPNGMIPAAQNNIGISTQSSGSPTYQMTSLVQFSTDGTVKLFNLPTGLGYVMFNHSYMLA